MRRRILVLGSSPPTRLVDAYTWDRLPRQLNVADYDVVVLNLTPFLDQEFAGGIQYDTLPSVDQFAQLMFSKGSEIIAIGVPGNRIGIKPSEFRRLPFAVGQTVTWWMPLIPNFEDESGEEIRDVNPEFDYYFRHVRHWVFYAGHDVYKGPGIYQDISDYARKIHPQATSVGVVINPLAQTRFHQAVAMEFVFGVMFAKAPENYLSRAVGTAETETLATSGKVFWLPPPTEISTYEAVDLILRERYGVRFERSAPAWAEAYRLPHQILVEVEVNRLEQEIHRLEQILASTQQRSQEAARFRKKLSKNYRHVGIENARPM